MISWWIGSASRPQGRGQWGATYPASARSRPEGRACSESHCRTSTRRGSSSGATTMRTARQAIGPMSGWNWADVWETVAEVRPDAPAQAHGKRRVTWGELDRRADG